MSARAFLLCLVFCRVSILLKSDIKPTAINEIYSTSQREVEGEVHLSFKFYHFPTYFDL